MRARHAITLALATLTLAVTSACGDGRPPIDPEKGEQIGVEGGRVELSAGLTVVVPAGALDAQQTITVKALDDAALPAGAIAGSGFRVLPEDLVLQQPLTVTVAAPADASADWTRVARLTSSAPLPLVSAREGATISATLRRLGRFALYDFERAGALLSHTKEKITAVDVLMLIDNSGSMEQEQKNLAANFPRLIKRLEQAQLDYRVGVVSADVGAGSYGLPSCESVGGDAGKLQTTPRVAGCQPPTDPWVERTASGSNVPGGDVAAAFSCIAQLGTSGCGFEQHLESIRQALDGRNGGFIREKAALALVIVTDEDDCSAANAALFDPTQQGLSDPLGPLTSFRCFDMGIQCDVNDRTQVGPRSGCVPGGNWLHSIDGYVQDLRRLKPNGQITVSLIAGAADHVEVGLDGNNPVLRPSCVSAAGNGAPAVRLEAFTKAFGDRGRTHSICDADFGPALDNIATQVVTKSQLEWCLPRAPLDVDASTPALDADCIVHAGDLGLLPACDASSARACFSVETSATCQSGATVKLRNLQSGALSGQVRAACIVAK